MTTPRQAALVVGTALLFIVSLPGLWSGVRAYGSAGTTAQKLTVAGDILYGATGIILVLLISLKKLARTSPLIGWAILVTATAAIAPAAWGAARAEAGLLAGLSAAMVAAAVVWLTTRGLPARKS